MNNFKEHSTWMADKMELLAATIRRLPDTAWVSGFRLDPEEISVILVFGIEDAAKAFSRPLHGWTSESSSYIFEKVGFTTKDGVKVYAFAGTTEKEADDQ